MNREEPLCVRCAQTQRTCCQICEIYITPGDLERIAGYTGKSDFFEYRRPADPEYLDQSDDPLWAAYVFRPDGTRKSSAGRNPRVAYSSDQAAAVCPRKSGRWYAACIRLSTRNRACNR